MMSGKKKWNDGNSKVTKTNIRNYLIQPQIFGTTIVTEGKKVDNCYGRNNLFNGYTSKNLAFYFFPARINISA